MNNNSGKQALWFALTGSSKVDYIEERGNIYIPLIDTMRIILTFRLKLLRLGLLKTSGLRSSGILDLFEILQSQIQLINQIDRIKAVWYPALPNLTPNKTWKAIVGISSVDFIKANNKIYLQLEDIVSIVRTFRLKLLKLEIQKLPGLKPSDIAELFDILAKHVAFLNKELLSCQPFSAPKCSDAPLSPYLKSRVQPPPLLA